MSPNEQTFTKATHARRTFYALERKSPIPDYVITQLAESCLLDVPSAFNNQSTRMTVLLKSEHDKLWKITADALKAKIGEERFNSGSAARIAGFASAYGTILFWNDESNVASLASSSGPLYSDKAAEWTHQSNGMHQYYMWAALNAHGLGVNLQHYNPLIDAEVTKTWGIPENWSLKAQMVFGAKKDESVMQKEQKMDMKERLGVFGAED